MVLLDSLRLRLRPWLPDLLLLRLRLGEPERLRLAPGEADLLRLRLRVADLRHMRLCVSLCAAITMPSAAAYQMGQSGCQFEVTASARCVSKGNTLHRVVLTA